MARSKSLASGREAKKAASDAGWSKLTWADLESWAGSRSVERGRTYQRGKRVSDLKLSADGALLATVMGGERYTTTVALTRKGKRPTLESVCTCPVGTSCKHAVAVVADYLQTLADGRDVPIATDEDPRWAVLEGDSDDLGDDWEDEDDEDSWDEEDEDDDETYSPPRKSRKLTTTSKRSTDATNWNDKIEQHLRAKSQSELADLAWSLIQRFPEVFQEFREQLALQHGDVSQLLAETRREIRNVTSQSAWRNSWSGEGYTPDYSRIEHRFERLLNLGHADEVVSLGREFLREGLSQVNEANDEGEAAMAFAECAKVVFQAVVRSSLTGPERLLFAIDASEHDDIDAIDEASAMVFKTTTEPEDWSVVADTLIQRLKAESGSKSARADDDFSRRYQRDGKTGWIAMALENAGREQELRALYESEAPITGSYERLVGYLLRKKQIEDAERWAKEGIAATSEKHPGVASNLAKMLRDLAEKRKAWDSVAAHAAFQFFSNYPGASTFDELIKAAKKAKVEKPVRAAALHFLETGVMPYRVKSSDSRTVRDLNTRSSARKKQPASAPAAPPPPPKITIDPSWPLPIPDYLIAVMGCSPRFDQTPRPHLDVLLDMAIRAKRPDDVLRWFDKMRSESKSTGYHTHAFGNAERVAEAVKAKHPERSLEIYLAALNARLPHAEFSAYHDAVNYLKKLRPLYTKLDRAKEWSALVASIREKYRNRPRFMELLDDLDGRTIVESSRPRRK